MTLSRVMMSTILFLQLIMYGSSFLDGTLNSDTPGVVLDEEQPYIAQFPQGIINLNTDQYQNKKVIKFTK